ncbi:MAG: flagellar biosynthesis protein FlhF [Lachnospiraceae bacterium]|nr:flagellar biosynthesis protein FlhF [Lachnospiraceae bacterium]
MIIKKFQAKTESEATETARRELGDAVVIMNVRNVKRKGLMRFFSSPLVEVTVALEEEPERPKPPTMTALEQLAARQKQINEEREHKEEIMVDNKPIPASSPDILHEPEPHEVIEEKLNSLENLLKNKFETHTSAESEDEEESKAENLDEQMKFTKLLYNVMIENEVNEKYANAIIEETEKTSKLNMPFDYMLTNIYQKMILKFGNPSTVTPASKGPKVVYFVGPTGVGKTTTIAKIASKLCVEDKKKVALLTADTYRIAAAEQLRTYANILEIPFRIIYTPTEVEQAYEAFSDYDYILVDTAGHSHHNEEQRNNTNSMIHAIDDLAECEVYLVLSATTKYRDLTNIADAYKEMGDYKIIFTKLDETTALGNLLNLRLYTGADMSYVTYGQNVPDDIDRFNPQTTVKSIMGGKA